jgi:hypothetical protein
MRDFVDTLPMRLAAVVAALVGAVCLWNGVEIWESARRIGIAFAVLLAAGLLVRRWVLPLMREGPDDPVPAGGEGLGGADAEAGKGQAPPSVLGRNTDITAPGTPISDLLRDDSPRER